MVKDANICSAQLFVWDHIRIYVVQSGNFLLGFHIVVKLVQVILICNVTCHEVTISNFFVDKELICVTLYKLKDKNVKD